MPQRRVRSCHHRKSRGDWSSLWWWPTVFDQTVPPQSAESGFTVCCWSLRLAVSVRRTAWPSRRERAPAHVRTATTRSILTHQIWRAHVRKILLLFAHLHVYRFVPSSCCGQFGQTVSTSDVKSNTGCCHFWVETRESNMRMLLQQNPPFRSYICIFNIDNIIYTSS